MLNFWQDTVSNGKGAARGIFNELNDLWVEIKMAMGNVVYEVIAESRKLRLLGRQRRGLISCKGVNIVVKIRHQIVIIIEACTCLTTRLDIKQLHILEQ